MKNIQITGWCSRFIEEQVQEGDLCIDATAGNGSDTLLLSRLCGSTGHVLAFDIQRDALDHTKEKLLKESPFQKLQRRRKSGHTCFYPCRYGMIPTWKIAEVKYNAADCIWGCICFHVGIDVYKRQILKQTDMMP